MNHEYPEKFYKTIFGSHFILAVLASGDLGKKWQIELHQYLIWIKVDKVPKLKKKWANKPFLPNCQILMLQLLTLVLLNKLRCHAHFQFTANQITWSWLLI